MAVTQAVAFECSRCLLECSRVASELLRDGTSWIVMKVSNAYASRGGGDKWNGTGMETDEEDVESDEWSWEAEIELERQREASRELEREKVNAMMHEHGLQDKYVINDGIENEQQPVQEEREERGNEDEDYNSSSGVEEMEMGPGNGVFNSPGGMEALSTEDVDSSTLGSNQHNMDLEVSSPETPMKVSADSDNTMTEFDRFGRRRRQGGKLKQPGPQ